MWNDYDLPTTAEIDGKEYSIRTDYRAILDIIYALNDPDLLDEEKTVVCMQIFYPQYEEITNIKEAVNLVQLFINGNKVEDTTKNNPKLMDWKQDLPIIIAPINRIIGKDVRSVEYMHWWTFLSAFMEIGECTFNTYVGIRSKLRQGKKLEGYEEKILKSNRNDVVLKKRVDTNTQKELDDILGR